MCGRVVACLLFCAPVHAQSGVEAFDKAAEFIKRGDYEQAFVVLDAEWRSRKQTLGIDHLRTLEVQHHLGQVAAQLGHGDKAIQLLRPVVDRFQREFGPDDRLTYTAVAALGVAHREAQAYKTAIRLLESAVASAAKRPQEDSRRRAAILGELAVAQAFAEKRRDALVTVHQALNIRGPDGAKDWHLLMRVGQVEAANRRWNMSIHFLETALQAARALLTEDHTDIGAIRAALGVAYLESGRYPEAERELRVGVESLNRALGPDHYEVAWTAKRLAHVLKKQKRREEAKTFDELASGILSHRPNESHRVSVWALREGR